ncbi:MAG: hypothetical protein K8T90_00445 [Planctomycetes bacterium]|nr:hypothetical protein [Planctomycetota bacterium]
MDARRRTALAVLLVVSGVLAGVFFRVPILRALSGVVSATVPMTAAAWDEQVRLDAVSLLAVVAPDPKLPESLDDPAMAEFNAKWAERRAKYSPERLDDLRTRLHDYLDFLQAEHADCAEIYRSGRRPETRSDAAEEARRRMHTGFGVFADTLTKQADDLREDAFRASPKVARGEDPDVTDFRQEYDDLRAWLPRAHRRVDELTKPVE